MKIIQKKKGVSEVVSVVLIIMITVAAVAVLWTVVIPMIKENTTSGAACFKASESLSIVDDQYTCFKYNATSYNNVSVKVAKSSSEANVSYAQVIVYYADGSSQSFVKDVRNVSANTENTYIYNVSSKNATHVAVASILTTGKTNTTCTVSPKTVLIAC
jgi:flagellin-like protein